MSLVNESRNESRNESLTFGQPNGCSRTSCEVYVTMAVNPFNSSYLDIYMEGTAAGWVAVGFSDSQAMVSHSWVCDGVTVLI